MMASTISNHCSLLEDLIIDILLFLPVKSLLRFKSVCKRWNTIISGQSFTNLHFHHETNCSRPCMYEAVMSDSSPDHSKLLCTFSLFFDETLKSHEEQHHMELPGRHVLVIRGPCNGIFCVLTINEIALWNPAIRRLRPLPLLPAFPSIPYIYDCEIGFGMDPLTNDYKIVLISGKCGISSHFVVYTLSSDSWIYRGEISFHDPGGHYREETPTRTTFLNGFYYWHKYNGITSTYVILQFDMHNEIFEEIELPQIVRSRDFGSLYSYNDSLTLFSWEHVDDMDEQIDIWLMKEKGCWTKLSTLVLPRHIFSVHGFGNSKIVAVSSYHPDDYNMSDIELIIYDLDSGNTNNVRLGEEIPHERWLFNYKESLISVEGKQEIKDYDIQSAMSLEYFNIPIM